MDLRISETGIRPGELIAASPSGKQNRGTVMEVRGFYSPDINRVNKLDPITLRDVFNVIPFFTGMQPAERLEWLKEHATPNKDLYLDDTDIQVKFVKIGGKNFFSKALGQDGVNILLRGNPKDPEGFWPIKEVYEMFPRKPGSRARKTTLIFRPSNWSLMIPERLVNTYTGIYIVLNTNQLASGTINSPPGGKIYSFELESTLKAQLPKLGIVVTESRNTPLTENVLFNLASNYVRMEDIEQIKPLISWFPPSMHKSLIQKLIRTRCESVEYGGKLYSPDAVLLTSLSLLLLNPGVFVPNIRRFVTGMESAAKRLAVTINEDSFTQRNDVIMGLYAASMIAQDDRNWLPTDTMIDSWFSLSLEAQKDHRMYQYDWKGFNGVIRQYDPLSLSYFLLGEIRSFQSDIDMVGSIAQYQGVPRQTVNGKIKVMPLIHCLDHHSFTELAHFMPYTGQPYSEMFSNIWRQVVGVNPRKPQYENYFLTMEQQPFVHQVRNAQKDAWISKMYVPQPRLSVGAETDFMYRLDPSWLAGLVGPIEIRLPGSTAIVVLRVDNIYEMTAVKRPQRDTHADPELTEEEQITAIEQARMILSRGYRLGNVPVTLPLFNGAVVTLRDEQYIITLNTKQSYYWDTLINMRYKFPVHKSIEATISNALMYTGDGIDQASSNTINYIAKTYSADVLRRLSTYLTGYKSTIELAKISRDGSGTYYQVVPEDTAVNHILCYLCVMYPAAIMKTKSGFQVKTGPLLWTIRDMINQELGKMITFDRKWVTPTPETRQRWEHQIDSFNQMVERNKAGKKGHLVWIKVGLGKCLHPDTPVLTWDGSIKLAKNIVPGDKLVGDDNTPRNVLSTCRGTDKMYKIKQIKGDDYIVNEPHILSLKFSGHKSYFWMEKYNRYQLTWFDKNEMRKRQKVFTVGEGIRFIYKTKDEAYNGLIAFRNTISDDDIVDITVKDFLSLPKNTQKELKGFKVGVDYPEREVSIDPYILGCWLGDGSSNGTSFTNVDGVCLDAFTEYMELIGCELVQKKHDKIRIRNKNNWLNRLDQYNLIDNKYIPIEYLHNSREVRLQLLAGLIDTDGYYGGGCYEIIQKRRVLSENIQFLARSLGYAVTRKCVIKTCTNGKNGPVDGIYYKCIISGDLIDVPCKIERKKPNKRLQRKDPLVTGIEIEPVGMGEYCGFMIDGNRRFLLSDFTVTHNTMITIDYLDYLIREGKMPAYCVYSLPASAINNILKEFELRGIPTKLIDARQSAKPRERVIEPYMVCLIKHDHMRLGDMDQQLKRIGREMVFIVDEFHKTLSKTIRTSLALELSRLSYDFIGMSGTIIKDTNYDELIQWLVQIVEFEVTEKNYWVAIGALVSRKVNTKVVVDRQVVPIPIPPELSERYYSMVPEKLGGTARQIDFNGAVALCYQIVTQALVNTTYEYVKIGEGVFLVAKDISHQNEIRNQLLIKGMRPEQIHLFSKDAQVTLTPDYNGPIKVVITTKRHSEGYTLTKFRVMITSVYFSNQATREQLEGRINRIGQISPNVRIMIYHTGILSYIHEKYEKARTLSEALKGFAGEVGVDYKTLQTV